MVVEVNVSVNHLISLGKGSGLVPVDAFCFEDRKEIFGHSVVIWVSSS